MSQNAAIFNRLEQSTLRQRMRNAEPVYAAWLQSGDWRSARSLAEHFSLVVIDMEHGSFELDAIALCVEVLAGNGAEAIVRVPYSGDSRSAVARRVLDAGAVGVLFPNVQTAEEARVLVANCYYPSESLPYGTRGFGFGGCNADGSRFKEYAALANERVVVGVQLENRLAFRPEVLEGILQTPGLIFSQDGPYDHSGSYLVPGQSDDERVQDDLRRYRAACEKYGVVAGKHVVWPTGENISAAIEAGYRYLALGTDQQFLRQSSAQILSLVGGIKPQ